MSAPLEDEKPLAVTVHVETLDEGACILWLGRRKDIFKGMILEVEKVFIRQRPDDAIRGVGPYHSRVEASTEKDFDRLAAESEEVAPWMETCRPIESKQAVAFLEFLHSLQTIGDRARRIFFARLEGLTWAQIGLSLLRGATPQAAENEFRDILANHPMLASAFPDRKTKGKT